MLNSCNALLCFQPCLYNHSMSGQKFSLTKHRTFPDRHTYHRWHGKYQPVMTLCCLRPKLDPLYSQYKFSFFQRISCFKLWHKILLGGLTAVLPSKIPITGKYLSEALLFAENGENMLCTKIVLNVRNNFCTQHVLPKFVYGIFMYWTCNSMNNLSSYCGLVDAKISASDKDLPV